MGVIRKMNKRNRDLSRADVEGLTRNVRKLVAAGYLLIQKEKCAAAFKLECWNDRDDSFKDAWCNNILTYWCIENGHADRYNHVLVLYDLEQVGRKIGTWHMKTGFVPMDGVEFGGYEVAIKSPHTFIQGKSYKQIIAETTGQDEGSIVLPFPSRGVKDPAFNGKLNGQALPMPIGGDGIEDAVEVTDSRIGDDFNVKCNGETPEGLFSVSLTPKPVIKI